MKNKNFKQLQNLVKHMPELCGVYLWKNTEGKILYIGKAINIRSRLMSYFSDPSLQVQILLSDACAVDCIVVHNEYEALLLENNLIKQHKPHYNVKLKDQKTYPFIRITKEDYPRVFKTREKIEDGSLYYGPYPDVKHVENYLKIIFQIFHTRRCKSIPLRKRENPCLYYHMHQCSAPCCDKVDKYTYNQEILRIRKLLEGGTRKFCAYLQKSMNQASHSQQYELAAQYRDAVESIKKIDEQQFVEDKNQIPRDYLAYSGNNELYRFVILSMRNGKMLRKSSFQVKSPGNEEEILEEFILQYYETLPHDYLPEYIFLEHFPRRSDVEFFLKEKFAINLKFKYPKKGSDLKILRMTFNNATLDITHDAHREGALTELKTVLRLPRLPRKIVGFDISQLSGYFTVASIVPFFDGMPDYYNYRTQRIKYVEKGCIDDFKSLSESIARYLTRLINSKLSLPDLILIDGGKGQLSAANSVIEALELSKKVAIISLAKREEEIFTLFQNEPIILKNTSPALRLCQAIRDETHRLAIARNRKLRSKNSLILQHLQSIPGIGPQKSKALLTQYISIVNILEQSVEDIRKVAKISLKNAEILIKHLSQSYQEEQQKLKFTNENTKSLKDPLQK